METTSVFDRLVEELSREERRALLAKLEETVVLSSEPLNVEPAPETEACPESEIAYHMLPPFLRFLYIIKGAFTGKTGQEVYAEALLSKIKREIARRAPKLADFRRGIFLERMKKELERLKESADFFIPHLLPPSERVRSEFIAFLVRRRCEPLMKRLEDETDPRTIVSEHPPSTESDIKSEMERRFLSIIGDLDEADRSAVYLDCQALDYLKAFCDIDYESILSRFTFDRTRGCWTCGFGEAAKRLLELADVLTSIRLPPSKTALQALFLYTRRGEMKEETEWERFIEEEFAEAEKSLARIREFNRTIPLDLLTRVLSGDCDYRPNTLSGGEDWFVLFKKYWAARLGALYRGYVKTLRTSAVVERAFSFLGIRRFESITHYHPDFYDPKLSVTHWRSLSFIRTFFTQLFVPRFLRSLKVLSHNGEFYKTENRVVFADVFAFLSTLGEKLLCFERRFEPDNEIGRALADIRLEKIPERQKLKKIDAVLQKADAEARELSEKTIDALRTRPKILNGILFTEPGGAFDTLSNLGYIGGKENEVLRKEWGKISGLSHEAAVILSDLLTLEAPG